MVVKVNKNLAGCPCFWKSYCSALRTYFPHGLCWDFFDVPKEGRSWVDAWRFTVLMACRLQFCAVHLSCLLGLGPFKFRMSIHCSVVPLTGNFSCCGSDKSISRSGLHRRLPLLRLLLNCPVSIHRSAATATASLTADRVDQAPSAESVIAPNRCRLILVVRPLA